VQLLVEQVDVREDALEVRIRARASRASWATCGMTKGKRRDERVESRRDGKTLLVRIPLRSQR
jgi:hypothetical protein